MTVKKMACGCLAAGLLLVSAPGNGRPGAADPQPLVPPKKNDRPLPVPETPRTVTGREASVGVKEIPRPDGGKDIIYYSVTPEADRRAREQAERYKLERSLDLPREVIILGR